MLAIIGKYAQKYFKKKKKSTYFRSNHTNNISSYAYKLYKNSVIKPYKEPGTNHFNTLNTFTLKYNKAIIQPIDIVNEYIIPAVGQKNNDVDEGDIIDEGEEGECEFNVNENSLYEVTIVYLGVDYI